MMQSTHVCLWLYGEREREMIYLTTHSTHFIYGYMASDIWLRTILIVRKETRCHHIGYSYRLTARVLLYAPSHRQDNTYHSLCYTSHGALAGTRNSSMGPPHEGSIRRPIAPWANALPLSYVPLLIIWHQIYCYGASLSIPLVHTILHLSINPSIHPSIHPALIFPSFHPYIHTYLHLFVDPSIYLFLCLYLLKVQVIWAVCLG